jgi:hypothetical protein
MVDFGELRAMSPEERLCLRRALAELDAPDPANRRMSDRRRKLVLVLVVICCIVLAAWIGVLAVTLPRYFRTGGWRGAWIGFDIGLLVTFVATGWAAWRRRQILIICLVVLATLLCCDAWFDVVLDARTGQFWVSLFSAVVVELPLAVAAVLGARRLIRVTNAITLRHRGDRGPVPRLRDIPLAGLGPGRPISDLLRSPEQHLPDAAAESAGHSGG